MTTTGVDPAVAEASRMVAEEAARFRAALPALLADPTLAGRWVLFRDGTVVAAFDGGGSAYDEGCRKFGELGGFVIARVEPERVLRVPSVGAAWVAGVTDSDPVLAPVYWLHLGLPGMSSIEVYASVLARDDDVVQGLLGRDALASLRFTYDGPRGAFTVEPG